MLNVKYCLELNAKKSNEMTDNYVDECDELANEVDDVFVGPGSTKLFA